MIETQTTGDATTLAGDVLAVTPRIAEAVRAGRATRIALVGAAADLFDELAARHDHVSVLVVDEPPADRRWTAGARLVASGPFDLIVVRGPISDLGAPLDTLLMCRNALVDRGLAVIISDRVPALDALAVAAGFTAVATDDHPSLTVFRP